MPNLKIILFFIIGVVVGGYMFSGIQPRSFLAVKNCDHCWDINEITGLMAAVGIIKAPNFIPSVVKETEKTIAVNYPFSGDEKHFVIFPKKDIKDMADILPEDKPYILDMMDVAGELARENKLRDYILTTNGPEVQAIRYLHFHLIEN